MTKVYIVNQSVGPYYKEILKKVSQIETFDKVYLLTGTTDAALLSEIKNYGVHIITACKYRNDNVYLRLLTWLIFTVQAASCAILTIITLKSSNNLWVFSSNPPVLSPIFSSLQLHRVIRFKYLIMDVYPELLVTSGKLHKTSIIYRLWVKLDESFVRSAESVITLDDSMKNRLMELYPFLCSENGLKVLPLTLGVRKLLRVPRQNNTIASNLRYEPDDLVIGYAGNAGVGHDFSLFLSTELLLGSAKLFFIGSGVWHAELKKHFDNNKQVQFRPFYDHQYFASVISLPDLSVISVARDADSLMIPSKFFSCVSFRIPILYIGPDNHSLSSLIEDFNLGYCVSNGDISALNTILNNLDIDHLRTGFTDNFDNYLRTLNNVDIQNIIVNNE